MPQNKLRTLKQIDISKLHASIVVVKEYKKERISQYDLKYVSVNEPLEKKLKSILKRKIDQANTAEEYTFDCPEPEEDLVRSINYEETDFFRIMETLKTLNPETDRISSVKDLLTTKAYLVVLRDEQSIRLVGFKTIPENWKMKKTKNLISIAYKNNQFEDLEEENVFSIANTVDLIFYDDLLFILSKKQFEFGLNFRNGMIAKANEMYVEVKELTLYQNVHVLEQRVGNNQRYLRKIATIKNLGHYKSKVFLERLAKLSQEKGWTITFADGQIVFTEETLDDILTVLQNKRLFSELTLENFDVESVKALAN